MSAVLALLSLGLFALAIAEGRDVIRLRRWQPVKATVVHWREALPTGARRPRVVRMEYMILDHDGAEGVHRRTHFHPDATYYAEMLYFVDGVAHAAELSFREPVGDSVELLVDPENPSEYEPGPRSVTGLVLCTTLGALLLWAALQGPGAALTRCCSRPGLSAPLLAW